MSGNVATLAKPAVEMNRLNLVRRLQVGEVVVSCLDKFENRKLHVEDKERRQMEENRLVTLEAKEIGSIRESKALFQYRIRFWPGR